jgi:hypothetical protein
VHEEAGLQSSNSVCTTMPWWNYFTLKIPQFLGGVSKFLCADI